MTSPGRSPGPVLLVVLVTALALAPVLANGFVSWDDETNFLNNFSYRGLGPVQLEWMWTTRHMGHYVPLAWMTLGADYLLWGMNPLGYHLGNLVFHLASAVLVWAIAARLLRQGGAGPEPAIPWLAAVAALLFAIHPLRVESVAWITERRDVLSGFFFFLAIYCYLRWRERGSPGRSWYVLAVLAAAAALLSKAMAVTLPAVLLLLDLYPLGRIGGTAGWTGPGPRRVYLEKVPFVLLSLAGTVVAFRSLGSVPQLPVAAKAAVSLYSLTFYLQKTIFPLGLAPLYPMPASVDPLAPRYLLSAAVVALITAGVIHWRRRLPLLPVAWAGFVLLLLPVIGLHQNGPQIAADRYTYLAGAVVGIAAAAGLGALRLDRRLSVVAAGAVLGSLGVLTWRQTGVWHDSGRLWSRVLEVEPGSAIAHNNWGNVLAGKGNLPAAAAEYRRALDIDPRYPEAHNDLGVALARLGRPADALLEYQAALAARPAYAEAHVNRGSALAMLNRGTEALEEFRRAVDLEPANAPARIDWGNELVRVGRAEEALEQYRLALVARPGDADADDNWGVALMQLGRTAEALDHFRRAARNRPGDPAIADHVRRAEAISRGRP